MKFIVGVDEVGLGPVAGPVVVAAAALRAGHTIVGVTDSKKLTANRRRSLIEPIKEAAVHWVIAQSSVKQIDRFGIARCKQTCMKWAAIFCLHRVFPFGVVDVIVDGIDPIPGVDCSCIIKADVTVPAVSAASILAKVHRDALMEKAAEKYPRYGFDKHKGYLTAQHRDALSRHGPCPIHRRSYEPIKSMVK
jgi:ribonuclease HII